VNTQTLRNGVSSVINLQPAETLKVVAVTGNYTLTGRAGSVAGTTIATAATGGTYGPYAAPVTLLLASSAQSEVDFDYGTSPLIESDTVARISSDPLTGGKGLTASGVIYGMSGIIPATQDSAGIIAAMQAAAAVGGGGVVTLFDAEYTIDAEIPLISGVRLQGVPNAWSFGGSDNVPDFWTVGTNGTRFNIAAGLTALYWNKDDLGTVQSPLMNFALREIGITGIAFVGGHRAIKIGAVNAMGCVRGELDLITAYGQTAENGYAIDICNSQFFHHGRIAVRSAGASDSGGNYRIANILPEASLLSGDSHINEIFSRVTSPIRKGVVFEAAVPVSGASILNDIKVTGRIHSSRYSSPTPATVSLVTTSGNVNISVPNAAQFDLCQVGMPIRFQSTAPTAFDAVSTYFVVSRNTGNQTVTLAEADYASAVTPTASNTYATYVAGFPTFIARADSGCAVKNSDFGAMACEVTGNIGAIMFSKTRNCNVNLNNPSTSFTQTGVICRDAEIGITYSGSNNVTMDESSLTAGVCNFVNLAGGAYQYSGGSFTLDSSWHGRTVRYSGTSDITITIPRKLPRGFKLDIVATGATGIITFATAAGLGLWSKSGGFRTNGQNARASLINVSSIGYHLSGDLQV